MIKNLTAKEAARVTGRDIRTITRYTYPDYQMNRTKILKSIKVNGEVYIDTASLIDFFPDAEDKILYDLSRKNVTLEEQLDDRLRDLIWDRKAGTVEERKARWAQIVAIAQTLSTLEK